MAKEPDFVLSIGNPNGDEKATYEGYVNGFVWKHENVEDHDYIEDQFHFGGHVRGDWDHFAVRGWVTDFALDGPAQALINGENVRAQDVPDYRPNRFADNGDGRGRDRNRNRGGDGGGGGRPNRNPPENKGGSSDERASWLDRDGRITNTRPTYGIVNRPLTTVDHRDVWVGHGDFKTGDGSRGEPFGTVQDALNARPTGVRHRYTAHLMKGVHDDEPGDSLNMGYGVVDALRSAEFKIVGDEDNPEDYVLDTTQMNFQLLSPCLDTLIEGVHLKGAIQMNGHGSGLTLKNCIHTPAKRWGKGDPVAVDFYGGSVMLLDTRIEGEYSAFNLTENGQVYFGGSSSVDVDAPLCTTGIGGGTIVPKGGTNINADSLTSGWEPAPVVVRDTHGVTDHLDTGGNAIRLS